MYSYVITVYCIAQELTVEKSDHTKVLLSLSPLKPSLSLSVCSSKSKELPIVTVFPAKRLCYMVRSYSDG